jgi:hypothetical protein
MGRRLERRLQDKVHGQQQHEDQLAQSSCLEAIQPQISEPARPAGDRFVITAGELRLEAETVVVAMANYQEPRIPEFAIGTLLRRQVPRFPLRPAREGIVAGLTVGAGRLRPAFPVASLGSGIALDGRLREKSGICGCPFLPMVPSCDIK